MLVHRSRERSERWRRWIIAGIALTAGTFGLCQSMTPFVPSAGVLIEF